jgi:hypothetical protein
MLRLSTFSVLFFPFTPPGQFSPTQEAVRIIQSEPVTHNNARFVIVTQADWKTGKPPWKLVKPLRGVPIEIQLHITNLGRGNMIFSTSSTFGLRMARSDGTRIKPTGGADHILETKPLSIPPGSTFAICRRAELIWDAKNEEKRLVYWDGTGSEESFGPLTPGRYKISFYYVNSPPRKNNIEKKLPGVWYGEVSTREVAIEVLHQ